MRATLGRNNMFLWLYLLFYWAARSQFGNRKRCLGTQVCCLVAKSYPTLCDSMDCSMPGSVVRGISQSGLLPPSPGDLPNPGIKPVSLALAGRFLTTEPPGKPEHKFTNHNSGHAGIEHGPTCCIISTCIFMAGHKWATVIKVRS